MSSKSFILISFLGSLFCSAAFSAPFQQSFEKDFSLRRFGAIRLTNLRGALSVKGWAQDRIRVKGVKVVEAETQEQANEIFNTVDLRFNSSGKETELSADYGKGLNIEARIQERSHPKSKMDIEVYVPTKMDVTVLTIDGAVDAEDLNGTLEIRTSKGNIHIQEIQSHQVSLVCPSCEIHVKKTRAHLRVMGGEGTILLSGVQGEEIYVESTTGFIRLENMEGAQLYVSKSGSVFGDQLRGRVEFHTNQGSVQLTNVNGFVSGTTDSGSISVKVKNWKFYDKAFIETELGTVHLELPTAFSALVDFWSPQGKLSVSVPVREVPGYGSQKPSHFIGPLPITEQNRLQGGVGTGVNEASEKDTLRVYSAQGTVEVSRASL